MDGIMVKGGHGVIPPMATMVKISCGYEKGLQILREDTLFISVPMNVRCLSRSLWQLSSGALLLICSVAACTSEYSLDGLDEGFSARRQQLNELKTLTAHVAEMTSITGYSAAGAQFLMAEDKFVSIPESLEKYSSLRGQLLRISQLVQELHLKTFSVGRGNSIYIMMSTGGALGSSSGYIYDESKELLKGTQKHRQVTREQHWYVFYAS